MNDVLRTLVCREKSLTEKEHITKGGSLALAIKHLTGKKNIIKFCSVEMLEEKLQEGIM